MGRSSSAFRSAIVARPTSRQSQGYATSAWDGSPRSRSGLKEFQTPTVHAGRSRHPWTDCASTASAGCRRVAEAGRSSIVKRGCLRSQQLFKPERRLSEIPVSMLPRRPCSYGYQPANPQSGRGKSLPKRKSWCCMRTLPPLASIVTARPAFESLGLMSSNPTVQPLGSFFPRVK